MIKPFQRQTSNIIRVSEIGNYLFCQRAWWYQRQGFPSGNLEALSAGTQWHYHHGRSVKAYHLLRLLALGLGMIAILILTVAGRF